MHARIAAMREPQAGAVLVRYPVHPFREAWVLPEGPVPESTTHDAASRELWLTLDAWVKTTGRNALVVRNLAVRWMEDAPTVGIDPDTALIEPAPPQQALSSYRLWEANGVAPRFCVEIVSKSHPHKDYAAIQDRYAAMGARELVVFDPLMCGPASLGGPVALQIWRRDAMGVLERVHFGSGPAYSIELGAWLHADGKFLRIADDEAGRHPWLTSEERERAEKERERAEKERALAELESARAEKRAVEERLAAIERRFVERDLK